MVAGTRADEPDTAIEGGRLALARGAWAEARARFTDALAREETPEAFEGAGLAARYELDGRAAIDAHERGYRLARSRGDATAAARLAIQLCHDADLGTGSGVWAVQLASRGWSVTGVDLVDKALRRARDRADQAEVEIRLVRGDATALRRSDVGSGFRLVLDTGTFHGLSDGERRTMALEVGAIAAPDATVVLDCFAPGRRGPLPRGASRADVEASFVGWTVTDVEVADSEPDALARLFRFDERFYRLRRSGNNG